MGIEDIRLAVLGAYAPPLTAEELRAKQVLLAEKQSGMLLLRTESGNYLAESSRELDGLILRQNALVQARTEHQSFMRSKQVELDDATAAVTTAARALLDHTTLLQRVGSYADPHGMEFLNQIEDLRLVVLPNAPVSGSFTLLSTRLRQIGTGLRSPRHMPDFTVNFAWNSTRVASILRVYTDTHIRHPHINSGSVCLGDSATNMQRFFLDGDILQGLALMVNALTFYNPFSAYSHQDNLLRGSPWSSLVCERCNEAGETTCLCVHEEVVFCATCLAATPVKHCGSCPECCQSKHRFSLERLQTNTGLNNSGCWNE